MMWRVKNLLALILVLYSVAPAYAQSVLTLAAERDTAFQIKGVETPLCQAFGEDARRAWQTSGPMKTGADWLGHSGGQWITHPDMALNERPLLSSQTLWRPLEDGEIWQGEHSSYDAEFVQRKLDLDGNGVSDLISYFEYFERGRIVAQIFLTLNCGECAKSLDPAQRNWPAVYEAAGKDMPRAIKSLFSKGTTGGSIVIDVPHYTYGRPMLFAHDGGLYKLSDDGREILRFDLDEADFEGFSCGWQVKAPMGKYADSLDQLFNSLNIFMAADSVSQQCGGSGQYGWRQTVHARSLRKDAILRPWQVAAGTQQDPLPYNDWQTVQQHLATWKYQGLWNYHAVHQLHDTVVQARASLIPYFQKRFAFDVPQAEQLADHFLNYVVRLHFVLPAGLAETADDLNKLGDLDFSTALAKEQGLDITDLERAILDGRPARAIETYLVQQAEAGVLDGLGIRRVPGLFNDHDVVEGAIFKAIERPDILRLLIDHGADVNARNDFGKTPLMYAAHFNQSASVDLLLEAGADVNLMTFENEGACLAIKYHKRTALMYAAENAGVAIVKSLLAAGADPRAVDSQDRPVADYLGRNAGLDDAEKMTIEAALKAP